jgi:hypothetical protein
MTLLTATYVYDEGSVTQTLSRFDATALEDQFAQRPGARIEHCQHQIILINSPDSPLARIIIDMVDASELRHVSEEE